LYPKAVYSVSVSASQVRAKVSLGTNPWNQATADKNLATLAEKFGGGGHQRVSAISFEPNDLPRAREVARELAGVPRKALVCVPQLPARHFHTRTHRRCSTKLRSLCKLLKSGPVAQW